MSIPDSRKVERLFQQAVELPADQRSQYLDEHCDDQKIREEVEKLLQYDGSRGAGIAEDFGRRHFPTVDMASDAVEAVREVRSASPSGSAIDHGRFIPGTVLSERYRIVGMLGKGGMGEVYRADDLELGQSVALKFLPKRLADDQRALERFRGEVRLARQVSHPNVCRVYDIGQIDGQWFLSMEYVDGEDLAQLLRRIGSFNAERATELARQLCLGLYAAHERGVLHRDLKPANIMIDGRGKVRITDFGLAEVAENVRDDDIRSGTPAYMAPEQLAGREVTERSDIYSLGAVLHEIYTGKAAWAADSMAELLQQRSSGSSPTPTSHVGDLDPAVSRVIERCLEADPDKRPDSAVVVLGSLPGGDPLAAALGAGEMPSPKMVAAAGDNTKVDPRWSVIAVIAVALGLLLAIWLEDQTSVIPQSSLDEEPAVLRHEAQQMLREEFGYSEPPLEDLYGFRSFPGVAEEPMSFWYRQRQSRGMGSGFEVNDFWSSTWGRFSWVRPDAFQPSFTKPGEVMVILSGNKQLHYFRAKPELDLQSEFPASEPRWSEWFSPERTGIRLPQVDETTTKTTGNEEDLPTLRVVKDRRWSPPDAFDALGVWEGTHPDGTTFLVEAAAWRGKPTYFRKSAVHGDETALSPLFETTKARDRSNTIFLFIIASVFCGLVLAIRNVRSGHTDHAGGLRLAVYVGIINVAGLMSLCRFPGDPKNFYAAIMVLGMSQVLFEVARTWMWYVALEPFVRKVWPHILITTSRLLGGQFRDPLVGRDILAGSVCGVLIAILFNLNLATHAWFGVPIRIPDVFNATPVAGTREFIGMALASHSFAFFTGVFVVMLLMMSRILFRTERVAVIATHIAMAVMLALVTGGSFTISIAFAALMSGAVVFLLVRFGILAALTCYTCRYLLGFIPMTFDTSRWYSSAGFAAVALVAIVSLTGFYLATSERSTVLRTSR